MENSRVSLRGFPPKVYFIGAQKSGTTALAHLLDKHPSICLSDPKEPDYYSKNRNKGLDWYQNLFADHDEQILVDASTSYTSARLLEYDGNNCAGNLDLFDIPHRIHTIVPDARFIYMIRDPVERTYSSYWHNVRRGVEKNTFRDAITSNSYYLRLGDYSGQLQLYLDYFSHSAFKIFTFEKFKKEPEGVLEEIFQFLDVNKHIEPSIDDHRHQSFTYPSWINALDTVLKPIGGFVDPASKVKQLLPASVQSSLFGIMTKKIPEMKAADREFLRDHFKLKKSNLEKMLDIKLDEWKF